MGQAGDGDLSAAHGIGGARGARRLRARARVGGVARARVGDGCGAQPPRDERVGVGACALFVMAMMETQRGRFGCCCICVSSLKGREKKERLREERKRGAARAALSASSSQSASGARAAERSGWRARRRRRQYFCAPSLRPEPCPHTNLRRHHDAPPSGAINYTTNETEPAFSAGAEQNHAERERARPLPTPLPRARARARSPRNQLN